MSSQQEPQEEPPSTTTSNTLDDIFGSSPPDDTHTHTPPFPATSTSTDPNKKPSSNEPSELPSLRRQHVTAGYRDGISASKAQHVQRGFDAGFPIGAQLGMRAGTVLGILEGVLRGVEGRPGGVVRKGKTATVAVGGKGQGTERAEVEGEEESEARRRVRREQVLRVYRAAVKELAVQAVFAGAGRLEGEGEGEEKKPEEQLLRMGDAVLAEWEGRVAVALWEENNMDVLEARSEGGDGHGQGQGSG